MYMFTHSGAQNDSKKNQRIITIHKKLIHLKQTEKKKNYTCCINNDLHVTVLVGFFNSTKN